MIKCESKGCSEKREILITLIYLTISQERVAILLHLKIKKGKEKEFSFTWGNKPVETQFEEDFIIFSILNILYYKENEASFW